MGWWVMNAPTKNTYETNTLYNHLNTHFNQETYQYGEKYKTQQDKVNQTHQSKLENSSQTVKSLKIWGEKRTWVCPRLIKKNKKFLFFPTPKHQKQQKPH